MQQALLHISLTYCAPCGYTEQAIRLTEEILSIREIEYYIAEWKLVPASHGLFEVTVNDKLVFSKKAQERHPEPGEVRTLIEAELEAIRPSMRSFPKDE